MTNMDAGLMRPGHAQNARIPQGDVSRNVIPQFFEELRPTDGVDEITGARKFVSVEYVRLVMAGDKTAAPVKRVTDDIKHQYADSYARWKATKINSDMADGDIPLALWPTCPPAVAESLRVVKIASVQQLADIPDANISQAGAIGLRELRQKARNFLETLKTTAPIARLQAENSELKNHQSLMNDQIQKLIDQNNDLQKQVNDLAAGGAVDPPPQTKQRGKRSNEEEG